LRVRAALDADVCVAQSAHLWRWADHSSVAGSGGGKADAHNAHVEVDQIWCGVGASDQIQVAVEIEVCERERPHRHHLRALLDDKLPCAVVPHHLRALPVVRTDRHVYVAIHINVPDGNGVRRMGQPARVNCAGRVGNEPTRPESIIQQELIRSLEDHCNNVNIAVAIYISKGGLS
jgi:hypothetical protein